MSTNPNELSVTTFINAPPDKVWHLMTEHMEDWWCPRPWRTEIVEQDKRPGGRCAMVMHGPEGEHHAIEGVYLAWDKGRRFVTTDAITADFWPSGPFMIGTWEITPEDGGTRYTATARHWTEEACEQHRAMGFEDGWAVCAQQLKELCES